MLLRSQPGTLPGFERGVSWLLKRRTGCASLRDPLRLRRGRSGGVWRGGRLCASPCDVPASSTGRAERSGMGFAPGVSFCGAAPKAQQFLQECGTGSCCVLRVAGPVAHLGCRRRAEGAIPASEGVPAVRSSSQQFAASCGGVGVGAIVPWVCRVDARVRRLAVVASCAQGCQRERAERGPGVLGHSARYGGWQRRARSGGADVLLWLFCWACPAIARPGALAPEVVSAIAVGAGELAMRGGIFDASGMVTYLG